MNCSRCDRPVRFRGDTLKDNPGTVKSRGRGLCEVCWKASVLDGTIDNYGTRRAPAAESVPACVKCQRPARAAGVKASDAPGSIRIKNRGMCHSCYGAQYINGGGDRTQASIDANRRTLDAYLARRRSKRLALGTTV